MSDGRRLGLLSTKGELLLRGAHRRVAPDSVTPVRSAGWFSFEGALVRAALLLACWLSLPFAAAHAADPEQVLVIYSNGRPLPANAEFDSGLSEVMGGQKDLRISLTSEFLDFPNFSGAVYERTVSTYLRDKYANRKPRLIIAVGSESTAFVLRHRQDMFPGVPILFAGAERPDDQVPGVLPPGVFGISVQYDFVRSVEQVLQWRPHTRRLLLVTGTLGWDQDWARRLQQESRVFDKRLEVESVTVDSSEALQKLLGELGDEWMVFTPGYFRDGQGSIFTPRDAARLIAMAASVPVMGPFSTFIGTGILGGYMPSYVELGRTAARAAVQVIGGEAPASVALPSTMPVSLNIDWRQAQRWGIGSASLPPDTVVQFRAPGFWEQYRAQALTGLAVLLLQFGLIAALLFERRRRRRTAIALKRSEQYMGMAAQAARLKLWFWQDGRNGIFPAPSPAAQVAEKLSDFADTLAQVHAQDREGVGRAFENALASGKPLDVEFRVQGGKGEMRWQAARGRVEASNPQRLLGVTLDISARKRAELQAEQDRAALRHITRVSLLGQLSASIAHQLNQPLASILSNAEAAQLMLDGDPPDLDELRAICADIVDEDQRAAAVIRQLGSLFRRGEPALTPTDLNALVHDTLELLRANLLTRQVQVRLQLAPALPAVRGDRVQLQQLLLNLIVNAADALAGNEADARWIELRSDSHDGDVRICVADNGPGLQEADLEKLFDPFWSHKQEGMGIGLTICRSIAIAHQGTLVASNGPESGAVFCLRLPAGENAQPPLGASTP